MTDNPAIAQCRKLENKISTCREKICDITDEIEELQDKIELNNSTIQYLTRILKELGEEKEKLVQQIYKEGKP